MTRSTAMILLLGRVAMLPLFALSGLIKLLHPQAIIDRIAATGHPAACRGLCGGDGLIETVVIVLFVVGGHTRTMAYLLLTYCLATAVLFHFNFHDQPSTVNFLKNLAIAGGLAQAAALGGGRYSLDHVLAHWDDDARRPLGPWD